MPRQWLKEDGVEWQRLAVKPVRYGIGLMSGTSCDGVDAALVRIRGTGASLSARLLLFETVPYKRAFRERLMETKVSASDICELNADLGFHFAEAAVKLIAAAKRKRVCTRVDFVASHGHTVVHLPRALGVRKLGSTLQIGDPAVIAERTGLPVVSNFRERDIAAGGQGAPLVPYVDWLLFRKARTVRVCLNLGGIANCTFVMPHIEDTLAYDTGPGNMPIDGVVHNLSGGRSTFDRNGKVSASGVPDHRAVYGLLQHPYFRKSPPKSTGRDQFDARVFCRALLRKGRTVPGENLVATVTEAVACSIGTSILRTAYRNDLPVAEIIASGGGVHNMELMHRIRAHAYPIPVRTSDEYGWPADAKEAVAFAILGNETLCGTPANIPRATGARHRVVLGRITPP
jgi:anhydro-N-acetylmuramic acid kinase